jgi:hypothetical protein
MYLTKWSGGNYYQDMIVDLLKFYRGPVYLQQWNFFWVCKSKTIAMFRNTIPWFETRQSVSNCIELDKKQCHNSSQVKMHLDIILLILKKESGTLAYQEFSCFESRKSSLKEMKHHRGNTNLPNNFLKASFTFLSLKL